MINNRTATSQSNHQAQVQNINMNSARADDELITSEMRQTTGGDMGQQQLMTQSELFKSYAESNQLFLNISNSMHSFEFGGNKLGRLYIEGPEAE